MRHRPAPPPVHPPDVPGPAAALSCLVAAALLLLVAPPAAAQPRPFGCVGAEALEEDVFAVPFAPGGARLGVEARAPVAAAAALARANPARPVCVLGHATRDGGVTANARLSATRARAVAGELARAGLPRERIRAEARGGGFSRRSPTPSTRSVTIVVLPERATPAAAPR